MFLAAVGRQRRDTLHNRNFSGKIGIFPFTRRVPALRNSRHRAAGTMVTQMVEVHKEVYKEKMLSDVFPAIKRPCGRTCPDVFSSSRTMLRPITSAMTPTSWLLVQQMGGTSGSSTSLQTAPTPNILDLGFFNSIQSLQDRTTLNTVDELIVEVKRVFDEQDSATLGRVWTTYQAVLEQIMLAKGDNTFKLPHLHKETRARRGGSIARALPCSNAAWVAAQP